MQSPARVPLQPRATNIVSQQLRGTLTPVKSAKRTYQHAKLDENSKVAGPQQQQQQQQAAKMEVDDVQGTAAVTERRSVKRVKVDMMLKKATAAATTVTPAVEEVSAKDTTTSVSQALQIRRWAQTYLKQFPSHIFYFDHCSEEDIRKCTKRIHMLDGNVEPFFSKKVNVVVTTREFQKKDSLRGDDSQEASAKTDPKQPANDVLVKAQAMNIRIWSLKKLKDSVLKHLLAESQTQPARAAQSLSHSLRNEKTLGTNSENIIPFTGPFILCRDMSEAYRPIMMREWKATEHSRDGEWPQWRVTKFGRCPFQRDLTAEQSKYQGKVTTVRPDRAKLSYDHINASGMVQITSAIQSNIGKIGRSNGLGPTGKENAGSNAVASLHKKAVTSKRLPKMLTTIEPVEPKKVKVELKSGYCENCRDKFESIEAHLKSLPHRQYASNEENFRELDVLLGKLKRVPLPGVHVPLPSGHGRS
ncbi:Dfp1/Him1, central region-domain-containing protein [Protomyces lactucae-debilis]|uniref:Dfp1/Him1, central region-domain-containing protein n=1 Tax=Protomyces lactucae-debilis TaxID=2754530 RepID=A0A1Y2F992_PROLT|nr:Dfp1/Him1, central region-domain-containing protein [Protomyces lactucae-debilis]ORY80004.1 Dfp1/Him1, central region-domain-containing protein [Protomyces lactucae-debilis]